MMNQEKYKEMIKNKFGIDMNTTPKYDDFLENLGDILQLVSNRILNLISDANIEKIKIIKSDLNSMIDVLNKMEGELNNG